MTTDHSDNQSPIVFKISVGQIEIVYKALLIFSINLCFIIIKSNVQVLTEVLVSKAENTQHYLISLSLNSGVPHIDITPGTSIKNKQRKQTNKQTNGTLKSPS